MNSLLRSASAGSQPPIRPPVCSVPLSSRKLIEAPLPTHGEWIARLKAPDSHWRKHYLRVLPQLRSYDACFLPYVSGSRPVFGDCFFSDRGYIILYKLEQPFDHGYGFNIHDAKRISVTKFGNKTIFKAKWGFGSITFTFPDDHTEGRLALEQLLHMCKPRSTSSSTRSTPNDSVGSNESTTSADGSRIEVSTRGRLDSSSRDEDGALRLNVSCQLDKETFAKLCALFPYEVGFNAMSDVTFAIKLTSLDRHEDNDD